MNFFEKIKQEFKVKNNLNILIIINLSMFMCIGFINLVVFLTKNEFNILDYLALSSDVKTFLRRPWSVISYMFSQSNFFHLLFNVLVLYWFGKIFLSYLSDKQLLGIYLLGGISGALFFIVAYNIIPVFFEFKNASFAVGASASVMAVVFAIAFVMKNLRINLMFFGQIKILYIAIVVAVLDIINIAQGNAGGHITHLGGAIFGLVFALLYKKNIDITKGFTNFIYNFKTENQNRSKKQNREQNKSKNQSQNQPKTQEQAKIDLILEKIKQNGYASLSPEEKAFLFKK